MNGPKLPFSDQLHAEKYRSKNESFTDAMTRVAGGLTDNDDHFQQFRDILLGMRFMPGGRVQSAIGATRNVTPYNCFVSADINDSFVSGPNSIMGVAKDAAATMRQGGGIGYDFSPLRPNGALITQLESYSSGPISFMQIFDSVCKCVASSGHRRGAQMAVLRVDHPDIEDYIHAKQPNKEVSGLWDMVAEMPEGEKKNQLFYSLQATLELTGFNTSIAVTDEFMECVRDDKDFDLRFEGQVYRTVKARALWDKIMRSTWDWAEPGVLFIDAINRMNNLYYCEKIVATNPCGEQPLPPHGACLLGSFNLVKYIMDTEQGRVFNWELFHDDIFPVVRAMDNVVDAATYPLPQQEKEAKNKRRMGLGITGLANAAEALGYPYGSDDFLLFERRVLEYLRDYTYEASSFLAKEKGCFPLYDKRYLKGEFFKTLPAKVQTLIRYHGIRNSHLTSIAPTGTISLCADNVSSGIEPVFSYSFDRIVQLSGGAVVETVTDYGYGTFGVGGVTTEHVTPQQHVDVLNVAARLVDSSVSKTCNISADTTWEEFKQVYFDAWEGGSKGCTTFRANGKRMGIFAAKEEGATSCEIDPVTGKRNCE